MTGKEEKIYFRAKDVLGELTQDRRTAFERGMDTSFYTLDKFISFKKGFSTVVYSPPHVGKSVITLDMLVGNARRTGEKIIVYSPEYRKVSEMFFALIQTAMGKAMYGDNSILIEDEEFMDALEFIDQHFVVLSKPPRKKGGQTKFTVSKIFGLVKAAEKEYGWKFSILFIDPFNFLDKDMEEQQMQVQEYVLEVNDKLVEFSGILDLHTIISAHTRDMDLVYDKDADVLYYPVPHPSQIMSGQSWFRGGYQIIAYWRCPAGVIEKSTGLPYPENATDIICQKSKPYGIGRLDKGRLYFDPNTHRMFELVDNRKYFANEYYIQLEKLPPEVVKNVAIKPNKKFNSDDDEDYF